MMMLVDLHPVTCLPLVDKMLRLIRPIPFIMTLRVGTKPTSCTVSEHVTITGYHHQIITVTSVGFDYDQEL